MAKTDSLPSPPTSEGVCPFCWGVIGDKSERYCDARCRAWYNSLQWLIRLRIRLRKGEPKPEIRRRS